MASISTFLREGARDLQLNDTSPHKDRSSWALSFSVRDDFVSIHGTLGDLYDLARGMQVMIQDTMLGEPNPALPTLADAMVSNTPVVVGEGS